MPHQCHQRGRVTQCVCPAGDFVAFSGAVKQCQDVDSLEGGRQQSDGRRYRGAAADPIPHGEAFDPTFRNSNFIQFATVAGHSHGITGKFQSGFFVGGLCLQHTVAGLLGGTALGDHHNQSTGQVSAQFPEDPVHAVRIGVIQEVWFHRILRRGEGVSHELRTEGRTADADHQEVSEAITRRCRQFSRMHPVAEPRNLRNGVINLLAQIS